MLAENGLPLTPFFLNFRSKLINKIEHSDIINGEIMFIFLKLARYVVQYMTQYEINVGGTCIDVPGAILVRVNTQNYRLARFSSVCIFAYIPTNNSKTVKDI